MSYTIIPQALDINAIVDDNTIKVVGGKIEVSNEKLENIFSKATSRVLLLDLLGV